MVMDVIQEILHNVVQANLKACLAKKEASGKAFNIAFGGQISLNEMHKTLAETLKKDIAPIYGDERKGDIKHSNADISNSKKYLNYDPNYSFEDGIKLTIDWYKANL